jgi:hypothetical protein
MVLALVLAFVFVAGVGGAAFADTTDPFLNTYQDPESSPYRTEVLDNDEIDLSFLISPSINGNYKATFFSSQADAEAVAATVTEILDDPVSLSGPTSISTTVYDYDGNGSWLIWVDVELPNDNSVGSFTVQAINAPPLGPGSFANYTIIRNPPTERPLPAVTSVDVQIENPLNTADVISTAQGLTVAYNDYPSESDERYFPHALDATYDASNDPGISPRADNFGYFNDPDIGIFLYSIDVDGVTYGVSQEKGWQYRVYRQYASSAPDSTPDGLTEYVGIDAIELLDGDIVYWVYGPFDTPSIFPDMLKPRFPVPPVSNEPEYGIN